jgi:hypothetical protein
MNDVERESPHEHEWAWNRPLSACSKTLSHTGSAGHSPSPRRDSDRPRSTSKNQIVHLVRSRATAEEEESHERERNWGSSRPRWDHQYRPASPIPGSSVLRPQMQSTYIRKQAASPNPTTSHSRVRTNSELDTNGSALTRPQNALNGQPAGQHFSSHHSVPPTEAPEQAKRNETSRSPMMTSPQPKPINGYPHDKPLRMPSRHHRLGWQFP